VGYCARLGEVDLRLIGTPEVIAKGREMALGIFKEHLVSEDGADLETVVIRELTARNLSIATVESCTGGLIASRLTDVPGSSAVFEYGFVTYANEAKADLVGVKSETLEEFGAVSEEVAAEMAVGALVESDADIAVSVTGIAGPSGGTDEKPVGTVCFGIATTEGVETFRERHPRNRKDFKQQASQRALDLVRRKISV